MLTQSSQLTLFASGKKAPRLVYDVPVSKCTLSRFNPRKSRTPQDIETLAKRIQSVGFDAARAIRAYKDGDRYEVFGGGTRLEAARQVGVAVHVWVYEDYEWDEIARLAEEDNEGDSYHTPVKPMDVWAEYARLRDDEGWTQQRIAEAKGVSKSIVSERIGWHEGLPDNVKSLIGSEESSVTPLTEQHLRLVFIKVLAPELLATWADIPTWRIALLLDAANRKQSTRQLAKAWEDRKSAVENATALLGKLPPGDSDEYVIDEGEVIRQSVNWQVEFVNLLKSNETVSAGGTDFAFTAITKRMNASATRKELYESGMEAAAQAAKEEADRIEYIHSRWQNGSCLELLPTLEDNSVRLVLTDPPYGMDFQSNRRTASAKAEKISGDAALADAIELFNRMLQAVEPKLTDEAHLLVFTRWDVEYAFMQSLIAAGYTLKGSLIWVKENHTSGDLQGSFAPRHERIIHAVKGKPTVSPRRDDVFMVSRNPVTEHPTEKPVELLTPLIECTTNQGDLVIDPFGGTSATLVAAKSAGREWWGCELNAQYWNDGLERLKNVA